MVLGVSGDPLGSVVAGDHDAGALQDAGEIE